MPSPLQASLVLLSLVTVCCGVYVSSQAGSHINPNPHLTLSGGQVKDNSLMAKRKNTIFKSNKEILHYLKLFGTDMMIWRCKNAIQPYWEWQPIPVLELECETIGVVRDVEWYHNDRKIDISSDHYSQSIKAHMAQGQFYSSWLDFNLKIYNATLKDTGMYSFKAVSVKGFTNWQTMYVDISKKKKKKRNRENRDSGKMRKRNRRKLRRLSRNYEGKNIKNEYDRFYLFHKYHNNKNGEEKPPKEVKTGKNTYYTI